MIYIFTKINDPCTLAVQLCLKKSKINFIRINDINENTSAYFNNSISEDISIWIRKDCSFLNGMLENSENIYYRGFQKTELFHFKSSLNSHFYLNNKKVLGLNNLLMVDLNKYFVLQLAFNFGLCIPRSVICCSIDQIRMNFDLKQFIIVKPLGNIDFLYSKNKQKVKIPYTQKISVENALKLVQSDFMFPCLFQEYIKKSFEVRVFFISSKFYAAALVPLFDNGEVDIREQIQNCKLLPFKIPLDLKNKLRKLINYLGLKTGSIDLLVRNDGSFVFLEINPSGMFSQLSRKCNFGIEWEIIKYLN